MKSDDQELDEPLSVIRPGFKKQQKQPERKGLFDRFARSFHGIISSLKQILGIEDESQKPLSVVEAEYPVAEVKVDEAQHAHAEVVDGPTRNLPVATQVSDVHESLDQEHIEAIAKHTKLEKRGELAQNARKEHHKHGLKSLDLGKRGEMAQKARL